MGQYVATYACGHTEPVRLFGPVRQRENRLRHYASKDCRECWIAKRDAERGTAPLVPRGRLDTFLGRPAVIVDRGWEWAHWLAHRGYRLEAISVPDYDDVEPGKWLAHEGKKAWVKLVASAGEADAERAWLEAKCGGRWIDAGEEAKPRDIVAVALGRLDRELRRAHQPYVAFSGGKDSTVVLDLALRLRPNIHVIWSDDELEYPETVEYVSAVRGGITGLLRIVRGHATHAGWFTSWSDEPSARDPLPGTEDIPGLMDEWAAGEGYDLAILGLRAEESRARADWLHEFGSAHDRHTGRVCNPIYDWTADQVWGYIQARGLPYNRAYDRLEAIGIHRERQRVGPLPLTPRDTLVAGWPELLDRLEARYGPRWS